MLCSKHHCQTGININPFSYKISCFRAAALHPKPYYPYYACALICVAYHYYTYALICVFD